MFYAFTALWECSNAVYIFGGRDLMDRFGITNYQRALFAALCPAQIKFTAQGFPRNQWVRGLLHIGGYLSTFFVLRLVLRYVVETIEMYAVLEAEAIVICVSCLVHVWNVPPLLYQMFMIGYRVQVIYELGWNIVFGALGLVAAIEVYCDSIFERIDTGDGTRLTNKWWARIRFVLATASLRFAAYTLLHKCLNSSLHSLLGLQ
eukprot:scaffold4273_cov92-Skeletonema_marinoi.AAC.1